MFDILNEDNIFMYSINHYTNEKCVGLSEFIEDYSKITYIKRLFTQYENSLAKKKPRLQSRLIINHLILLYNVFDLKALNKILYFRIPKRHHKILKAFMVYLGRESDDDVFVDENIKKILREEHNVSRN